MSGNDQLSKVANYFELDQENKDHQAVLIHLVETTSHKPSDCKVEILKINSKLEVLFNAEILFNTSHEIALSLSGEVVIKNGQTSFNVLDVNDMKADGASVVNLDDAQILKALKKFSNRDTRQTDLISKHILAAIN